MAFLPLEWAGSLLTWPFILLSSIGLYVAYGIALAIYRVTIHPLAKFPGPKITAITGWYEFYVDMCTPKGFAFDIDRMHQFYGPIVRINPHEIHVSDPNFFDTLYAGGGARRDKYPPAAFIQGTSEGIFGTVDHNIHRQRRSAINSYFSKQSVAQDQPLINEKIELLCDFFRRKMQAQEPVNIRVPFLALTTDVFCAHTLGPRGSMDLLTNEKRSQDWRNSIIGLLHWTPVVRQFPWVLPYAIELPTGLIKVVSGEMALVVEIFRDMRRQARAAIAEYGKVAGGEKTKTNLFHTILASRLPESEKEVNRMGQEAFNILSASGDTIGRTLTHAMYHLHANPEHLQRLKDELKTVMPDPYQEIELSTLDQLPWMTAVLKESLRIAALITGRAPLISPDQTMQYQMYAIPPGTPVSMSVASMMMDPTTFPSPMTFEPNRWMKSNPDSIRNESMFFPFHRGHRGCIGINLAWCEMYLVLAKLLRRFDFELFEVVRARDVDNFRDCFLGEPRNDTKGVRMRVLAEHTS